MEINNLKHQAMVKIRGIQVCCECAFGKHCSGLSHLWNSI